MGHDHTNFLQEFETYMVEHSLQNKEIPLPECTCSIDITNIINIVRVSILLTLNS